MLNLTTICHAGQQPVTRLSCRTATTTRFSAKAARNRRRQGFANIRSGGLLPRKHLPDGATWAQSTHPIKQACYSFIDLGRMKGWAGLVGWPVADGFTYIVVTRRLQAERRTVSVCRPKTGVPPTVQLLGSMSFACIPNEGQFVSVRSDFLSVLFVLFILCTSAVDCRHSHHSTVFLLQ